ncbi:MAG: adenosylcobinamide-GDP ribazoletransferase [Candidatus Odinarchaeota archaeon]
MTILKKIKNCFSFLTRFPIREEVNIQEDVAPYIWLFPIIGFMLGLLSSIISLILFNILPFLIVGFIVLGLLLLMTGIHHTDGLIDFGDALMTTGSPEHKIVVMHDVAIGAGGFTIGLIILSLTGIAISYSMNFIIIALVLSEVGAKFSMVAACSVGKSAKTKMADPFIQLNTKKHMFLSLILSIILIYFTLLIISFYMLLYHNIPIIELIFIPVNEILPWNLIQSILVFVIFIVGTLLPLFVVLRLANRNFEGLTGDCLGALNEITRLFLLILLLIFNSLKFI